jgi:glycosyltransferase involved in cell wall biosynthesis
MLFPVLLLRRLCSHTPVLFFHVESNVVYNGSSLTRALCVFFDALSTKLASIVFDKILFSSPMLGELYHQMYGVPPEKIAVWQNAVELSFSESADVSQTRHLRKELGLEGRFGLLYLGAIRPTELLALVKAVKILEEASVNVTLVILGYGPRREAFFRYVQEHHLDGNVKLRGPVDHSEVPTYIAACDAGITPMPDNIEYRYQNPIKVLEFLAMNKPIIVSDIPAHRWIIGNKPVALYLKGTDPVSIAQGVRQFLASLSDLDPTLGEKIVRRRFTPEKVADILENQIQSCQTNI